MKCGIMTYQDTTNYGALLQAFATQRAFADLKIETELIDYKCENIAKRELPESIFKYGITHIPGAVIKRLILAKKYRHLERFKHKYCHLSERKYDRSSIGESAAIYDRFISGSDIIWELNVTGQDTSYYLDFAPDSKKYAFSSSFGYTEMPEGYAQISKELLLKYDSISVREFESAQIIKKLLNAEVPVTLDPTLLLTADQWRNFEEKAPIDKKYVLVYFDDKDHKILSYAQKLAEQTGCIVVYLSERTKSIKNVKMMRAVSVGQFLWLIDHAQYVVTASFHGVAFSINFNTQFCYLNRAHQGRINTLMKKMNIQDRDIRTNEILPLSWDKINSALSEERKTAFNYIKQISIE